LVIPLRFSDLSLFCLEGFTLLALLFLTFKAVEEERFESLWAKESLGSVAIASVKRRARVPFKAFEGIQTSLKPGRNFRDLDRLFIDLQKV
jgi:hypothetical protein